MQAQCLAQSRYSGNHQNQHYQNVTSLSGQVGHSNFSLYEQCFTEYCCVQFLCICTKGMSLFNFNRLSYKIIIAIYTPPIPYQNVFPILWLILHVINFSKLCQSGRQKKKSHYYFSCIYLLLTWMNFFSLIYRPFVLLL